MSIYHVTPADDYWQVREENVGVVSSGHHKQSGAKRKAYELAETGDEVRIHNTDGQIRNSWTVR
jgi:hypothetical protein